tara:strand:- start:290 stop:1219 length:930 start_codon:yes stop_codon:yes gene_type:complete
MKKLYINAVFQLSAISIIIGLFLFEGLDFEKLKFIFKTETTFLLIYLVLLKLFIAFLFFATINLVTEKKNYFNEIASTFLQGGIVNQLIPTAGLFFKYYKFKHIYNVSLAQYSSSQLILSLSSLLSYIIIAVIFGFLAIISFNLEIFFYLLVSLILFIVITTLIKNKLYLYVKNTLLKINRISNIINELIKIKNLVLDKKNKIFFIMLGFLLLAILECFSFYWIVNILEVNISFIKAIFLYVSTVLLTVLFLVNFIGLFEIVLVLSASLILSNYSDVVYIGLGFKVLHTFALIVTIALLELISVFKKDN